MSAGDIEAAEFKYLAVGQLIGQFLLGETLMTGGMASGVGRLGRQRLGTVQVLKQNAKERWMIVGYRPQVLAYGSHDDLMNEPVMGAVGFGEGVVIGIRSAANPFENFN